MGSSDGLQNSRSTPGGRETLIPNATPFSCIPPPYYNNNLSHHLGGGGGSNGPNPNPTLAEMIELTKSHHHRCSSESVLQIEEKPSWLDDLLDEPDSPLYKGHRRSASDSSAYIDMNTMSVTDTFNSRKESMFNVFSNGQQWNLTDHSNQASSFNGQQNWVSDSTPNSSVNLSNGLLPARNGSVITPQNSSGLNAYGGPKEADRPHTVDQKQDRAGSIASQNPKNSGENGECSQSNTSVFRADGKHAKQKTAHRSRVRKLQYIAELERNVQVLQAEGSEVFAEIGFLDQHNLILSMENRALRQRLDSLSQEQLIKQLQHEMLERELGRLQALFQFQMQQQQQQQQQRQQQQQQRKQQNTKNNRAKFKDLDAYFNNLSLNQNEATSSTDSANSYTRI